jgi:hypothetical protein
MIKEDLVMCLVVPMFALIAFLQSLGILHLLAFLGNKLSVGSSKKDATRVFEIPYCIW